MTVSSFHHSQFPADRLRAEREHSISVCVPVREEALTIAGVVAPLVALREAGVIDQVVVADADSADGTGAIAAELGAEVHSQAGMLADNGPVRGKGDAMWRALSVLTGELVCFVDGDTEDFGEHFACGLLGPLICAADVHFVKGFYRRPFSNGATTAPTGGGRVTELMARPMLDAFYAPLASLHQPLAGEVAARRELLDRLAFCTGYAVEIGLLLDVYADVGSDAIAQVDLGVRSHRHQPLTALGDMSAEVLAAITSRLRREGRLVDDGASSRLLERPPFASLTASAAGLGGYGAHTTP